VQPAQDPRFRPVRGPGRPTREVQRCQGAVCLGDHHAEDVGLVGLYVRQSRLVVDLINGLGGQAELLMLANGMGLRKNTHIAFADENNESVAELMEEWLMRVGLDVGLRNET